jgi:hypothetical protein
MAEILNKIAKFLQIEEEKTGVPHVPVRRDAVMGIPPVPKSTVLIKPVGASRVTEEQWKKDGEVIDSRIEAEEKARYLRPKDKPVRPLELSDWRRQK